MVCAPVAQADVLDSLAADGTGSTASSGHYLVKFVAGASEEEQAAALAGAGATELSYTAPLRLRSALLSAAAADELSANPIVARVEAEQTRSATAVPSDPAYPSQWSLDRIGWDDVYGSLSPAGTATVALLDTGVDAGHGDLAGNVVPGASMLDPGSNGASDPNGHGTGMAGIVAASTDNAEGMAGIGYTGVNVMPVTVLDSEGVGQDGDIIRGVIWAADHGADVILMAFSSPDFSPSLQEAIDYAWSQGAVLVAAAGNDGSSAAHFPAGDRGVVGVANTDESDALNATTNYGDSAFLAAPGTGIHTTASGGGYASITGTSASAATVAGSAALMRANSPDASNGTIVGRLARNADPIVNGGTGNGRLNLERAIQDLATEELQPAGAAPVGEGGPFVGPYTTAAVVISRAVTGNWDAATTWTATPRTGTITTSTASNVVNGSGTSFTTEILPGDALYRADGATLIGTVQTVVSDTQLTLTTPAANNNTNAPFSASRVPGTADTVSIQGNATVTIPAGYAAVVQSLDLNPAGTNSNTTLNLAAPTSSLTTTGNLRLNRPGGNATTFMNMNAGTVTVGGNVTFDGAATQGNRVNRINNPAGLLVIAGNLVFVPGSVGSNVIDMGSAPATGTIRLAGQFTTNSNGTMVPGGTFDFNGSSPQTIPIGQGAVIYNNLHTNNTSGTGAQPSTSILPSNVVGNLRVQSGLFNNPAFAIAGNAARTFEVASGATFRLGGATTTPGGFGTRTFGDTSTVEYFGGPGQTIGNESYGHLSILGPAKASSGTVTLRGNFSNFGSSPGTATFAFTGSAATQTIGGPSPTIFNGGITVNKPAGNVALAHTTIVNGNLTFTQGNITTGVNVLHAGSAVLRTSGHVVGNLRRPTGAGLVPIVFNVGTGADHTPVTVNFSSVSTPGNLTVSTTGSEHPNIAASGIHTGKSVNRYWTIVNSGTVFSTYNATYNFVAGDVDPGADPNNFVVKRYDGNWHATTAGTRTATSTQATGVNSFSDFAIGEPDVTGPETTGTGVSPTPTNTAPTVTASVSDIATGGNNVTAAEYFIDSPGAPGTGTAMAASDATFDSPTEGVTATLTGAEWGALTDGTYTVYVRGRDVAGNWGDTDTAGFVKDTTAPDAAITFPVHGAAYNEAGWNAGCPTPGICGTATDATSVNSVAVSIQRESDDSYWDGTTWGPGPETFVTASGTTSWSVALDPSALTDGDSYTVNTRAVDNLGNAGAGASATFSYDTTRPDVTVEQADGQDDPTNTQPIHFTAEFSEPVSAFDELDVVLGGTADSTAATVTVTPGTGNTYDIAVEGLGSDGTLTADVAEDGATDAAGNRNTASTSDDNQVTYDATDPESEASSPQFSNGDQVVIPVDYTASDNSGGSGLAEVELWAQKGDGDWTLADTDNAPGATGQFEYTPSGDDTYGFYTIAVDNAGNREAAPSGSDTVTLRDTVAPDVALTAPPAATNDDTPTIAGTAGTQGQDSSHSADGTVLLQILDHNGNLVQAHPDLPVNSVTGVFSRDADHLDDGDYTVFAYQQDAAGNVDTDSRDFTVDTVAPDAPTIDTGPDDPTNDTVADFTFTAAEAGGTLECKLDSGSYEECDARDSQSYSGLGEGSHTFSVRQVDAAGNQGDPDTFTWFVDLTAPNTTIDEQPPNPSNDATPTFEFSGTDNHSDPADLTFECKVDDGDWGDCDSPETLAALADGEHTFRVRATDEAGNTDGSPAEYTWVIDTVKPVSEASAPATTNETDATFDVDYTASDERSGLDKVELYASKNGGAYALANTDGSPSATGTFAFEHDGDGTYRFYTIATDNAGNVELVPTAADEVTIVEDAKTVRDTVAPTVTLNAPPAATNDDTPAVAGTAGTQAAQDDATADDDHVDVEILDDTHTVIQTHAGVPVNATTGAFSVDASHLDDGDYEARATQHDGAGNTGTDSRDFTVDTVAPDAPTIDTGPDDPTNETTADFTFTAAEAGGTLQCKLDSGSYEECDARDSQSYSGLGEGSHTFSVRQVDAAGNEGEADTFTWFVDLTAPETTIDSQPDDPSNDATPAFEFSGTDNHSDAADLTFECKVDDGPWYSCSSPEELSGLGDGDHTFRVRATDEAGNTDQTPDEFTWTQDTVKPVSEANAPATTNDTADTFDVHYEASDERSGLAKVELYANKNGGAYALANTDNSPGATGTFAFEHDGDGTYRFYTIATDNAGNVEEIPTAADEVTIVEDATTLRDTVAPTVTLNAPPANTNDDTPEVSGTAGTQAAQDDAAADDDHVTVEILDDTDTVVQTHSSVAVNGTTGAFSVDASHLDDGDYTARATQQDGAGNSDSDERDFTVDTVAPDAPTITDQPDDPTNATTATFTFTAAESGGTLQCKLDSGSYEDCTSPQEYEDLEEGSHTFAVRQVDAAGNEGDPDTFTWFVDLTAPQTTLDATPDDPSNDDSPSFEFSGTDNHTAAGDLSFECKLDAGDWDPCTSPEDLTGLSDDSHTFSVRATDEAGNTDGTPASFTWTIDTVAPDAPTITAFPDDPTSSDSATFEWTGAESGGNFECKLDGASFAHCSSPEPYAALAEGHHKFSVRQVDAAGNEGAVTEYEWDVDQTNPDTFIDAQPSNPDNDPTPTFEFSGTDNHSAPGDLEFECNVDGNGWNPCDSPETLAALSDDSHTFQVRATDEAGNTDGSPASYTWTIDTVAPAAPSITSPAEGSLHNTSNITLAGTAENGSTVEVFEGSTSLGTTTADGTGGWSKALTSVSDGSHTYTAKATDAAGNTSDASTGRTIVVDTVKPSSQASAPGTSSSNNITVTYTASDTAGASGLSKVELYANKDGGAFVLAGTDNTPDASQSFAFTATGDGSYGFYTVAYDNAGNVEDAPATADATTVVSTGPAFAFTGFFSPVNNLPTLNEAKGGSTIPVKFSLGGNFGLDIFEDGYPKSQIVPCNSTAQVDGIEETGTPGSSGLTYDAATQRYHYVWKTVKGWTGCRQLVLKFVDGSYARANFKFK